MNNRRQRGSAPVGLLRELPALEATVIRLLRRQAPKPRRSHR